MHCRNQGDIIMAVLDILLTVYRPLGDLLSCLMILIVLNILYTSGINGLVKGMASFFMNVPGVKGAVAWYLSREVKGFLQQIGLGGSSGAAKSKVKPIPEKGLSSEELMELLRSYRSKAFNPHSGKGFAYVYTMENEKFECIEKAYDMFSGENDSKDSTGRAATVRMFLHAFMHENALSPFVFPNLRQFEVEIVAMTAWMLNGPEGVVGGVTSGGTESILMAMKTYRDRARDLFPQITHPEVVAPETIHPAFEKAAGYFDLKVVHVPTVNYKVDMTAYENAITPNTILLLGSAPEYCHGIIDPIEDMSRLAMARKLPLHVDACFGGFMLPWVEKCGYSVPPFDFRLLGVTSMSADVHKYGYGPKGASVVMYRSADIRKYQIFSYVDWPGGLFGSPGMAGTRPGGSLASSWATLMLMGQDGYMDVAKTLMEVTRMMVDEINQIEELTVCGSPNMTAFAFTSEKINVFALADLMEEKEWKMERARRCIHCTILPSHTVEVANNFISDLKSCVQKLKDNPQLANKGSSAVYGMAANLPVRGVITDFVREFFNEVYTL